MTDKLYKGAILSQLESFRNPVINLLLLKDILDVKEESSSLPATLINQHILSPLEVLSCTRMNRQEDLWDLQVRAGTLGENAGSFSEQLVESESVGLCFDPVGTSFDSSDESKNSSDFEIADETDLSIKVEAAMNLPAYDEFKVVGDESMNNHDSVYDFNESDAIDKGDGDKEIGQKGPCCNNKCNSSELSMQLKSKLQEIRKMSTKDGKQYLLDHLYHQLNMGLPTHGFQFFGVLFCKRSFIEVAGLTYYLITEVFKAFEFGQFHFVHGNEIGMRESEATTGFVVWMRRYAENYGNRSPEEDMVVIPACFSIKDLFLQYNQEAPSPKIKSSTFYHLFHSKFGPYRMDKSNPQIRISSYSSHSKCEYCLMLEKYRRRCKTEQDREYAKSLTQAHKITYHRAYLAIQEVRYKAIEDPENFLYIQCDDMDNHKEGLKMLMRINWIGFKFLDLYSTL